MHLKHTKKGWKVVKPTYVQLQKQLLELQSRFDTVCRSLEIVNEKSNKAEDELYNAKHMIQVLQGRIEALTFAMVCVHNNAIMQSKEMIELKRYSREDKITLAG